MSISIGQNNIALIHKKQVQIIIQQLVHWQQYAPQRLWAINCLLNMFLHLGKAYPSQQWIAEKSNSRSRRTSHRAIKDAKIIKLIHVTYRHMTTCEYVFDPIIYDPNFQKEAVHYLPALRKVMKSSWNYYKEILAASIVFVVTSSQAIFTGDVTQTKSVYIYKPTGIQQVSKSSNKPAVFYTKKRENWMKSYPEKLAILEKIQKGEDVQPFSPVLEKIPIKLTMAGKCELSEFCDEAILLAVARFKKTKKIREPYAFMRSIALEYHKHKDIPVDWKLKKDLMRAYKIDKHAPRFEYEETPFPTRAVSPQPTHFYDINSPRPCSSCRSTRCPTTSCNYSAYSAKNLTSVSAEQQNTVKNGFAFLAKTLGKSITS